MREYAPGLEVAGPHAIELLLLAMHAAPAALTPRVDGRPHQSFRLAVHGAASAQEGGERIARNSV
eukprot:9109936-Pyramimonas_sp.AAC.1